MPSSRDAANSKLPPMPPAAKAWVALRRSDVPPSRPCISAIFLTSGGEGAGPAPSPATCQSASDSPYFATSVFTASKIAEIRLSTASSVSRFTMSSRTLSSGSNSAGWAGASVVAMAVAMAVPAAGTAAAAAVPEATGFGAVGAAAPFTASPVVGFGASVVTADGWRNATCRVAPRVTLEPSFTPAGAAAGLPSVASAGASTGGFVASSFASAASGVSDSGFVTPISCVSTGFTRKSEALRSS